MSLPEPDHGTAGTTVPDEGPRPPGGAVLTAPPVHTCTVVAGPTAPHGPGDGADARPAPDATAGPRPASGAVPPQDAPAAAASEGNDPSPADCAACAGPTGALPRIIVRNRVLRWLLLGVGMVSLVLGVIGVLLPVMPTMPFVIVAAWCFLRSSERLYTWIVGHPQFGPPLESYLRYKGITMQAKVISIAMLWVSITTTSFVIVDALWLRATLLGAAAAVTVYLVLMRTLDPALLRTATAARRPRG